jgi:copper chaperone
MKPHELTIEGMSCGHCVMHVKNALNEVDGLKVEDVQIGKASVWFDDEKLKIESIAAKINEAGYKLISIK